MQVAIICESPIHTPKFCVNIPINKRLVNFTIKFFFCSFTKKVEKFPNEYFTF